MMKSKFSPFHPCLLCGESIVHDNFHFINVHGTTKEEFLRDIRDKHAGSPRWIECLECEELFYRISPAHLRYKHNMTTVEYKTKHPGAKTLSTAVEVIRSKAYSLQASLGLMKPRSLEARMNMSRALKGRVFTPQALENIRNGQLNRAGRGIWSSYVSHKSSGVIHCRSTFEKKACEILDACSVVEGYIYEPFRIKMSNGRLYIPDILVLLEDGRLVLIEVKANWEVDKEVNLNKFEEARKFCKIEGDIDFEVWTEDKLWTHENLFKEVA